MRALLAATGKPGNTLQSSEVCWGVECWQCAAGGRSCASGLSFVIGGQQCNEILVRLGGYFEVYFKSAA
jgi:hypothetical protein